MARIRSIHPEQWTDDDFVTCSPLARLLALGLRNQADDNGIFERTPVKLKMRILPADNCDVTALLDELHQSNQVFFFTADGREFGMVRSFQRFQKPKYPSFVHPIPSGTLPKGYALSDRYSGSTTGKQDDEDVVIPEALEKDTRKRVAGVEERRGEKKTPQAQAAAKVEAPPRARPPENPRCAALRSTCLAHNVGKDAAERELYAAQWATEGIEDWQLLEAIRVAREERGKPLPKIIPAKFIAPILVDVVSGELRPPMRSPEEAAREFEKHAIAKDVAANPDWWLDNGKIAERGQMEGVHPIPRQEFDEYRARVLAAAGPGPWQDDADEGTRERIAHWLRVGINPPPPSARGPQPTPMPGRGTN